MWELAPDRLEPQSAFLDGATGEQRWQMLRARSRISRRWLGERSPWPQRVECPAYNYTHTHIYMCMCIYIYIICNGCNYMCMCEIPKLGCWSFKLGWKACYWSMLTHVCMARRKNPRSSCIWHMHTKSNLCCGEHRPLQRQIKPLSLTWY